MTTEYGIHPAADIFPMMIGADFEALKEDIREHGQREWATLFEGKIIDGRNRHRACQELGIETVFCEIDVRDHPQNFDPIAYVLSMNLHRRHLTREQRDEVIKKLRSMGRTCQQIADTVGVNKATVSRVVANATTDPPATITGKDGKRYPAKKAGRRERRADPAGFEQFKKDAAHHHERHAAKQTVAPADTAAPAAPTVDADQDPCRICGTFLPVAGGDRCQRCIDEGRTEPDDDLVQCDDEQQPAVSELSKNAIRQLARSDKHLSEHFFVLSNVRIPEGHPIASALSVATEAYWALHKAIEAERNQ